MKNLARIGAGAALAGDLALAIAALKESLREDHDDVLVLNALGLTLARALRPLEALPLLMRSLELRPDDLDILCAVGEISVERSDFDTAARTLGRCLVLDPGAAHPSGIRARALLKKAEKRLVQMVSK